METLTYPGFDNKNSSLIIKENLNYYIPFDREFHGLQNGIFSKSHGGGGGEGGRLGTNRNRVF